MFDILETQSEYLDALSFKRFQNKYKTLYKNPKNPALGYMCTYEIQNKILLWFGDYMHQSDFQCYIDAPSIAYRIKCNFNESLDQLNTSEEMPCHQSVITQESLKGQLRFKKNQRITSIVLFIDKSYAQKLTLDYPELLSLKSIHDHLILNEKVCTIIKAILDTMNKNQLTPLLLEAKVLESLCLIAQDVQISSKAIHTLVIPISRKRSVTLNHQEISLIQSLKEQLLKDLSEHVHLKSYCKKHDISEQKLVYGFKHLYGQTISQYVQSERMTKGRIMILSSDYSVDQVSELLGYSHPSNFVKAFKKYFNHTPHQYKKAYLAGKLE